MPKNRQKSSDKSAAAAAPAAAAPPAAAASIPEDAPKKSPKAGGTNGVSGPAPQGPRSGSSCLGLLAGALFYAAVVGAAGFAAFYAQQVVEEMRQSNARNEEGARRSAELGSKMESLVGQVGALRSAVDGLESSLGVTRAELDGAVARLKRGEAETRKVEEALHKLQNNLLQDLSTGLAEVKESREKDFSSLERTVEERLAEVSQSISATMAAFTGAQGEAQSQLADLKARVGTMEDPALLKKELESIAEAVAEVKMASEQSDSVAATLAAQIGAVRNELQTRNGEVASLSEEVEAVRVTLQATGGALKQSLSAAEATIQTVRDKAETLEGSVEQAVLSLRDVEKRVDDAAAQAQRRSDDLEARVKSSEESEAALSDVGDKLESLAAKFDQQEGAVAAQAEAVDRVRIDLEGKLEALRTGLEDSQLKSESIDAELEDVKKRLAALEASGGGNGGGGEEQLKKLKSVVDALQSRAAKHESHDQAIASLQDAVQKTAKTLAGLAKNK